MTQDQPAGANLEEVRQAFEAMKAMSEILVERLHAAEVRASSLETALTLALSALCSTGDSNAMDQEKLQALVDFMLDEKAPLDRDGRIASVAVGALRDLGWEPRIIQGGRT